MINVGDVFNVEVECSHWVSVTGANKCRPWRSAVDLTMLTVTKVDIGDVRKRDVVSAAFRSPGNPEAAMVSLEDAAGPISGVVPSR